MESCNDYVHSEVIKKGLNRLGTESEVHFKKSTNEEIRLKYELWDVAFCTHVHMNNIHNPSLTRYQWGLYLHGPFEAADPSLQK